jgi:hypothetical protein
MLELDAGEELEQGRPQALCSTRDANQTQLYPSRL